MVFSVLQFNNLYGAEAHSGQCQAGIIPSGIRRIYRPRELPESVIIQNHRFRAPQGPFRAKTARSPNLVSGSRRRGMVASSEGFTVPNWLYQLRQIRKFEILTRGTIRKYHSCRIELLTHSFQASVASSNITAKLSNEFGNNGRPCWI